MKVWKIEGGVPIKAWVEGVPLEDAAKQQLEQLSTVPYLHSHVAAMPDVHAGWGSTVGSVFALDGAVIPAAVGVDIGCGMAAARLNISASAARPFAAALRESIENAVPVGRTDNGGARDRGAWNQIPERVANAWKLSLEINFQEIPEGARHKRPIAQLGTLGTGNHFIELSEDSQDGLWIVLHSGSRGPGNKIGTYFQRAALEACQRWRVRLPHNDLAWIPRGEKMYDEYLQAMHWAQNYALVNRALMLEAVYEVIGSLFKDVDVVERIQCHHNYAAEERHFGKNVLVVRKGAVRASTGDMGIIPGSMGARSYVVCGLGNRDSFMSCSHGAGRTMSRTAAKATFTLEDHARATEGVECRKDADVLDETPAAYKDIDAVMAAQVDLVRPVYVLKQFVCVKG